MKRITKLCFLFAFLLTAQFAIAQVTVTGKVSNAAGNTALQGVSITEKGTNNGTTTDQNGNFSIKVKSATAKLVFSYVGTVTQEVSLGGKTSLSIILQQEDADLSEVTVATGRQPLRKLETTQAVDIIGAKQLRNVKPESFAEAVTLAPGVFANNSQGRRGGVIIRGFPDGNPLGGLVYTSILLDGLPAFGSAGRLPDAGFGFDANVEKVEVVRGSTATVFGRSAAAGVINVISKIGGEKTSGSFRLSSFDNIHTDNAYYNYKFDWNLNGSLTKDKLVRYNIGGWFLDDRGPRKTGYNDKGYQVRGNFDFLRPDNKQKIRLGFIFADYSFQNLTDVPLNMNTGKLASNWSNTSTFLFPQFTNVTYSVFGIRSNTFLPRPTVAVAGTDGQQITRNIGQELNRNYSKNAQLNFNYDRKFNNGWELDEKFRFQALYSATKYPFAVPSFYNSDGMASVSLPASTTPSTTYGSAGGAFRLMLDGDAFDDDVMNEFRLKKSWESGKMRHNFQIGHYFSNTNLRPTTYSYTHFVDPRNPNNLSLIPGTFLGRTTSAVNVLGPLFNTYNPTANPQRGSITRRGSYTEQVNGLFAGHDVKLNDKFSVNLGFRYDWIWIRMQETKLPFDSAMYRTESFKDYSGSLGINYMFNRNTSLYFNANRAFRMPDYTAFTSLEYAMVGNIPAASSNTLRFFPNNTRPNNEIVHSFEIGFRKQSREFGLDAAVFYNKIYNRLASIFENGLLQSRSFGSNRIMGTEVSLSYVPTKTLKGFSIRSSVTIQNAEFTNFQVSVGSGSVIGKPLSGGIASLDVNPSGNLFGQRLITKGTNEYAFDVKGNKLPGVPDYIWNTVASYTHKWFGIDFNSNVNGKRYADATNTLEIGNLTVLNAGGYVRIPLNGKKDLRLGLQVKNIGNRQGIQGYAGLADNAVALGQRQATPNFINPTNNLPIFAQSYLQQPRRWIAYISFDF